jgi:hypothetical protein
VEVIMRPIAGKWSYQPVDAPRRTGDPAGAARG